MIVPQAYGIQICRTVTPGVQCEYCAGVTPKKMQVTLSGISDCGCVDMPYTGSQKILSDMSWINGTFILSQRSTNPCLWEWHSPILVFRQWSHILGCASESTYEYEDRYSTVGVFVQRWRRDVDGGHEHAFLVSATFEGFFYSPNLFTGFRKWTSEDDTGACASAFTLEKFTPDCANIQTQEWPVFTGMGGYATVCSLSSGGVATVVPL